MQGIGAVHKTLYNSLSVTGCPHEFVIHRVSVKDSSFAKRELILTVEFNLIAVFVNAGKRKMCACQFVSENISLADLNIDRCSLIPCHSIAKGHGLVAVKKEVSLFRCSISSALQ